MAWCVLPLAPPSTYERTSERRLLSVDLCASTYERRLMTVCWRRLRRASTREGSSRPAAPTSLSS
eukprot:1128162-Rhodomonas_salina.4